MMKSHQPHKGRFFMGVIGKHLRAWVKRGAYSRGIRRARQGKSPHGVLGFAADVVGLPGFDDREQGYRDVVKAKTTAKIYSKAFSKTARRNKSHKRGKPQNAQPQTAGKPRNAKPPNPQRQQAAPTHTSRSKSPQSPKPPKRHKHRRKSGGVKYI